MQLIDSNIISNCKDLPDFATSDENMLKLWHLAILQINGQN